MLDPLRKDGQFLDMDIYKHPHCGWIEVICGSMFSGKSEELIRRLRRAQIAQQEVLAFKPRIDNRYATESIISHSRQEIPCIAIGGAQDIFDYIKPGTEVAGIDEAQFLDADLVKVCQDLADLGIRVICAGLDQNYRGEPWHPMSELMAVAEYVQKMLAICVVCGNPANRTQRKVENSELILVGSEEAYEPRCRKCHTVDEPIQTTIFPDLERT